MAFSRFVEKRKKDFRFIAFVFFLFYFFPAVGARPPSKMRIARNPARPNRRDLVRWKPQTKPHLWAEFGRGACPHVLAGARKLKALFFQEFFGARKDAAAKKKELSVFSLPGPAPEGLAPTTWPTASLEFGVPGATEQSYLLGLLAKIKCSICSYQLNLWYVTHGVTRV